VVSEDVPFVDFLEKESWIFNVNGISDLDIENKHVVW